jgi:tripartite-type tricarboxylate transporter receptor subunit TctC
MRPSLRSLLAGAILTLCHAADIPAKDAAYPVRPIQVVIPATPGGPVDTAIRIIEPHISGLLGSRFILMNRPGASGIIGMSSIATAIPDGYTIGAGVNSTFTVVHMSGSTVPYDMDSFVLIGNYATDVSFLAVHPQSPWKSFEDLLASVENEPGKLTYGSAGIGTISSLGMQYIADKFRLDMTPVHFAGGAQVALAILGRHVDVGLVPYSTGAPMLREQRLRPLGTTAATRLASLPDTPSLSEKGLSLKGLNLVLGLYAPKGVPDSRTNILVNALRQTMRNTSVAAKLKSSGLFAQYENPTNARERLENEYRDILELRGQLTK